MSHVLLFILWFIVLLNYLSAFITLFLLINYFNWLVFHLNFVINIWVIDVVWSNTNRSKTWVQLYLLHWLCIYFLRYLLDSLDWNRFHYFFFWRRRWLFYYLNLPLFFRPLRKSFFFYRKRRLLFHSLDFAYSLRTLREFSGLAMSSLVVVTRFFNLNLLFLKHVLFNFLILVRNKSGNTLKHSWSFGESLIKEIVLTLVPLLL